MGKSKERKIKNRNKQKEKMNQRNEVKVACRVHISKKKTFCQNSGKFGYSFIKNDIKFMYKL